MQFVATGDFSRKKRKGLGEGGYQSLKRRLTSNPFAGRTVREDDKGVDFELMYKPKNEEYLVDYGYEFDTETVVERDFRGGNENRQQIAPHQLFEAVRQALDELPEIETTVSAAEKLGKRFWEWLDLGGD